MQGGLCALRPRACIKVSQPNFTGKSISINKIRVLVELNLYNIPNIPSPRHEMLTRITHASISRQVVIKLRILLRLSMFVTKRLFEL
jgi:hypothetical protein